MPERYWPLAKGRIVTSPFGPRDGGFHTGVDFGFSGGSGGKPVYAVQSGLVIHAGSAQGYGGPDPNGWLVIDSTEAEGGGVYEYGHIRRLPEINTGSRVKAGQQIAIINPDSNTNGGTAPHLHMSFMPGDYRPEDKRDVLPYLKDALEPEATLVKGNTVAAARPDFNEFPLWSPNTQSRNGLKPKMALLHTQEGAGNALSLAQYLANPSSGVSYHYTISQDPVDNGVTVVDCVDTDLASWSVLDYNNVSISLCFAGSSVKWTREQWMQQSKAIDVAAYLLTNDARKYGFSTQVVPPPYTSGTPGISDHGYVTSRGIGSHSDCGPNFPWFYFKERVNFWVAGGIAPTPAPVTTPPKQPVGPANDQLTLRWNALGGQTLVEAVAEIRDKVMGTNDRNKTGVK